MSPSEQYEFEQLIGLYQNGRLEEAVASATALAKRFPNLPAVFWTGGAACLSLGRADEAERWFRRMLALAPKDPVAHNNLGKALQDLGRRKEALQSYERAIKFQADFADAYNNRGMVLSDLGRIEEAAESYRRALAIAPNQPEAHNNLGAALRRLGRSDEALPHFMAAARAPQLSADAYANLAAALEDLERFADAEAACRRALQINPNHAEALNNLGMVLSRLNRRPEAIASYRGAVAVKPDYPSAHRNLGTELIEAGDRAGALECLRRAVELDPELSYARAMLLHEHAINCDWDAVSAVWRDGLGVTSAAVSPFTMLALDDDPVRHRARAERRVAEDHGELSRVRMIAASVRPTRLRVGYFSGDFHDHATMALIVRALELHDRARFEIQAFSFGPDTQDEMRTRAKAAVDVFHDVRSMSDSGVAAFAREQALDIAVDLGGHSKGGRLKVFALGVAPVQISYLGYPGTTGAPFMDYIIADRTIVPEDQQRACSEKIIYLPHSYQATDNTRPVSPPALTRAEAGLPEQGFVFCSFNSSFKISAREFDIWMRLLHKTPGGVLWLLQSNEAATENLRNQAKLRGIDPHRLVFAPRLPAAQHLPRQQLADVFLDTFNCNAHTTASDALWHGLPVLTKMGASIPARVAASLLNAMDLPELVTESDDAYEARALDLAANPAKLAALAAKLAANRTTAPLFDTELFTSHLEAGYDAAYGRAGEGLPLETIRISPGS